MTAVLPARTEEIHRPMTLRPHHSQPRRRPIETRDLWKWVDLLTEHQQKQLRRHLPGQRAARVEHVQVPSLWKQMTDAVASSNSGGGHGKAGPGSRSPMDLALASLLWEIEADVRAGLTELGAQARVHVNTAALRYRHDTASDLRQLATLAVSSDDQVIVDIWVRRYRSWVTRAETALALEDASVDIRPQWGRACTCLAVWVTYEQDGEQRRDPALVAEFRDLQLQHLRCRACGADWTDDVDVLTRWLRVAEAIHGDARTWGLTAPRRESGAV